MEVKGVSVRSVVEFINRKYPGKYKHWCETLPETSRNIYLGKIVVNEWYPLNEGLTIPLHNVGKIFYDGDWQKAVLDMGKYSAEEALTGVYKLYVKMGSPRHIIDRASRIMSAYFQPSEMKVASSDKNQVVLHITRFDEPDEAIEYNISGWIDRALEISGCKNVKTEIAKSLARKDAVTEFVITFTH